MAAAAGLFFMLWVVTSALAVVGVRAVGLLIDAYHDASGYPADDVQ